MVKKYISHFLSAAISILLATTGCQTTTTNAANAHLDSGNEVSGFMAVWFGHVISSANNLTLILDPAIKDTFSQERLTQKIKEYIIPFPSSDETITGSLYVSPGEDRNSIYYVKVASQTASSPNMNTDERQVAFIINSDDEKPASQITKITIVQDDASISACQQITQKVLLPFQPKFMAPTQLVPDVSLTDDDTNALLKSNMSTNVNLLMTNDEISDYEKDGCYITAAY